jgi:hypothetical protein
MERHAASDPDGESLLNSSMKPAAPDVKVSPLSQPEEVLESG